MKKIKFSAKSPARSADETGKPRVIASCARQRLPTITLLRCPHCLFSSIPSNSRSHCRVDAGLATRTPHRTLRAQLTHTALHCIFHSCTSPSAAVNASAFSIQHNLGAQSLQPSLLACYRAIYAWACGLPSKPQDSLRVDGQSLPGGLRTHYTIRPLPGARQLCVAMRKIQANIYFGPLEGTGKGMMLSNLAAESTQCHHRDFCIILTAKLTRSEDAFANSKNIHLGWCFSGFWYRIDPWNRVVRSESISFLKNTQYW